MVRCWTRPQTGLEDSPYTDGGSDAPPRLPRIAFWVSVSAAVLLVVVALAVTGYLGLAQRQTESLKVVRILVPDHSGALVNQSALVDELNDLVTFSMTTSQDNRTATVLYDLKHGLVCYRPDVQHTCFLRKMDASDYEHVSPLLLDPAQQENPSALPSGNRTQENRTQRQTEFLGVLGGRPVDPHTLGPPLQELCVNRTIHWTRRAQGPGKTRLVYFCIDVCFPSNICVSVCFYYLPE